MAINDWIGLTGPFAAYSAKINTGETITAGDFVKTVGTEITQTGTIMDKLLVSPCDAAGDELLCVGIALKGGVAGDVIPIATRGIFRLIANTGITAGVMLSQTASSASMKVTAAVSGDRQIGIALTTCNAQNDYVLVLFQLGPAGAEA
jgi:hypothetical protein